MSDKLDLINPNNMSVSSQRLSPKLQSKQAQQNAHIIENINDDNTRSMPQDAKALRSLMEADVDNALKVIKEENLSPVLKKEAAEHLYNAFSRNNVSVRFDIDPQLNDKLVVKLVNKTSGEVVWQLPPEESLELQKLAKLFPGIYLNEIV